PRDIVRRGEDARFYDALRGVADELAGAVQSALTYARAQTGLDEIEPTGYHLCGGGARLDGLREYLEAAWATPVRWLDLGGWLARAQQVADPPSPFGVALGLALAAAEPQALALRLLPEAMERQQRFWRRTAFAAAAALLALLAVGVDAVGVMGEQRTQQAHLAALRDAVRESDEAAARIQQQMQRIEDVRRKAMLAADRARPNAVVLRTLDVLRRAAPAGITIESLRATAEAARPSGAGPARVVLTLKGVVERRGTATTRQELDRFAARLRGEPLRASIDRARTVGEATPDRAAFEIVLAPSPAPAESP
ncbi:hypothetical protein HQ576_17135, partial [bacterium]|nr:hypothetical protein [bacterium]